jgi:predicted small secreted protein
MASDRLEPSPFGIGHEPEHAIGHKRGGNVMIPNIKKSLLVGALFLWGVTALLSSGCATSRGFGQDVQGLGRSIEREAGK